MKHLHSKYSAFFFLGCLLLSVTAHSTQLETYNQHTLSDFSLLDLQGQTHTLKDYRGKVILVNFWASWCLPCIKEIPELNELKRKINTELLNKKENESSITGFEILAINVGEAEKKLKHFTTSVPFTMPILQDTTSHTFKNWQIKILPTSLLFDTRGRLRYRVQGNPGWDTDHTLETIKALLE